MDFGGFYGDGICLGLWGHGFAEEFFDVGGFCLGLLVKCAKLNKVEYRFYDQIPPRACLKRRFLKKDDFFS